MIAEVLRSVYRSCQSGGAVPSRHARITSAGSLPPLTWACTISESPALTLPGTLPDEIVWSVPRPIRASRRPMLFEAILTFARYIVPLAWLRRSTAK